MMDDLGRLGRVWHETDPDSTDRETVIRDLLDGQYFNSVRVISFNIAEGWSRDASDDIADALRWRCDPEGRAALEHPKFFRPFRRSRSVAAKTSPRVSKSAFRARSRSHCEIAPKVLT